MPLPADSQAGRCRSPRCQREILWIKFDGKATCVDPVRVRLLMPPDKFSNDWSKGELGYVPHFKTCLDPERFTT